MPVILHNTGNACGLFKKVSELVYKLKSIASAVNITSADYPALAPLSILPGASDWTVNGKPAHHLENYVVSFTITGTYASTIVTPYYLTTDKPNGILSIALCTGSTAYENVYISQVVDNTGLGITKIAETHVKQTGGAAGDYSATFFSGVTAPVIINVDASSRNTTYDYLQCTVTFDLAT